MRAVLAGLPGETREQTHGTLLLSIRTDRATAERIERFVPGLLREIGPWFRPATSPTKVYVFDTSVSLDQHFDAILEGAPRPPSHMGGYSDGPRAVTCSMEWGLGWLGDLCLRALFANEWRAAPTPNRWFPIATRSMLYNCFRDADGGFHGLNVASYYRPQAQQLADDGRLIPLETFLRDAYDEAILIDDALNVQGRAFLAWLLARGKLVDFFREYRRRVEWDPSGVDAVEHVMGAPITRLASQWRHWLMGGDAEIGDSEMAEPFPVLGILIARETATSGVGIWDVCPGGPAHRAGLRAGDRLRRIDGVDVNGRDELLRLLRSGAYGRTTTVAFERAGEHSRTEATLDRFIDG